MSGIERFHLTYTTALYDAVRDHREEYAFGLDKIADVSERMRQAFIKRSYNKDGRAIKNTCKKLGIKHTYEAINAFLSQEEVPS